jgi:thioredoxin-like negative regulator of GroEL
MEQLKDYEGKTIKDFLYVIECYDDRCKSCKDIAPDIVEFQTQLKKRDVPIKFRRLNVDKQSKIADSWKIETLPTFIILKNGDVIKKLVTSDPKEVKECIKDNVSIGPQRSRR